jgi:iron complex transport system ATP-binding protein
VATPLIELQKVSFYYQATSPILRDVSLAVFPKDFIAILGPNGAGKSTLLRLLSGALTPTSGGVLFSQKPISQIPRKEIAAKIAVMPQETPVSFSFTSLEVVLLGRYPHQDGFSFATNKDVEFAKAALQEVDALHLAERHVSSLSGGEKQRVFLARTLAQGPQTLLLDEPTAHLDLAHQAVALRAAAIRASTGAVVSVLHDCNIAALYANRIILLSKGEIFADGSPNQVLTEQNVSRCFGHAVELIQRERYNVPAILPLKD